MSRCPFKLGFCPLSVLHDVIVNEGCVPIWLVTHGLLKSLLSNCSGEPKKETTWEQVGFLKEYVTENIPGKVVRDPHENNYIYCIAKSIYCLLNTWDQFLCYDPANPVATKSVCKISLIGWLICFYSCFILLVWSGAARRDKLLKSMCLNWWSMSL